MKCKNCGKELLYAIVVSDNRSGKGGIKYFDCRCKDEKEER